jgi:AcrR family transcriptional regulator
MDKAKLKIQQFKQREQDILDASLHLLMSHGEDKVTVEQIAIEVDIGKGTIYKHFTSKTEIYCRLMFDYECALKSKLEEAIELADEGDYSAPARVYFSGRMENPVKARLFQRLEEKMLANGEEKEKLAELERVRQETIEKINSSFGRRIAEGRLKDAPPYYYYMAYWALTHGAVELYHNHYCQSVVDDMDGLMEFIMEAGVRMGLDPSTKK